MTGLTEAFVQIYLTKIKYEKVFFKYLVVFFIISLGAIISAPASRYVFAATPRE